MIWQQHLLQKGVSVVGPMSHTCSQPVEALWYREKLFLPSCVSSLIDDKFVCCLLIFIFQAFYGLITSCNRGHLLTSISDSIRCNEGNVPQVIRYVDWNSISWAPSVSL